MTIDFCSDGTTTAYPPKPLVDPVLLIHFPGQHRRQQGGGRDFDHDPQLQVSDRVRLARPHYRYKLAARHATLDHVKSIGRYFRWADALNARQEATVTACKRHACRCETT